MRAAVIADAAEFLQNEWLSVRERPWARSEQDLFAHFQRKFGAPEEVLTGYHEMDGVLHEPLRDPPAKSWVRAVALGSGLSTLVGVAAFFMGQNATAVSKLHTIQTKRGAIIEFNEATMSCVDRVHRAESPTSSTGATNPLASVGKPDCLSSKEQSNTYYSLGEKGELVLEFVNRPLCDGDGPDLAIFEVGHYEPVDVWVSEDGRSWQSLGEAPGGLSTFDLAALGLKERTFRFVRLRDAAERTADAAFNGADIDAVVAIHSRPAAR